MQLVEAIRECWETVAVAIILCIAALGIGILGASYHYDEEDELDWRDDQRRRRGE